MICPFKKIIKWVQKCIDKNVLFQVGQKEIVYKDFYKQKQLADIFTININKVVVSDKISFNSTKD